MQLKQGNFFQTLYQTDDPQKIFIAGECVLIVQMRTEQRDGAAKIPQFVGNHGSHNSIRLHQLPKVLFFPIAHFLGRIDDDGRQTRALRRVIGREPCVSLEDLAVRPIASALRGRPKALWNIFKMQGIGEHGQVFLDAAALHRLTVGNRE